MEFFKKKKDKGKTFVDGQLIPNEPTDVTDMKIEPEVPQQTAAPPRVPKGVIVLLMKIDIESGQISVTPL